MPRKRSSFRETDIRRGIHALAAEGFKVLGVETGPDGRILFWIGDSENVDPDSKDENVDKTNEWEGAKW